MSATQEDEIHRLKTSNGSFREQIVIVEFERDALCKKRDELRKCLEQCAEALETCARLPVARSYPDGPCMDKPDHDEVTAALTAARTLLAERPLP